METLTFEFPAGAPARGRALAGCVGSGDLEVLLEPGRRRRAEHPGGDLGKRQRPALATTLRAGLRGVHGAGRVDPHPRFRRHSRVVRLRLEQALESWP